MSVGNSAPAKQRPALVPSGGRGYDTPMEQTRALRVAIFLSGLTGGGAQRRSLLLARGLVERGCSTDVVVVRGDGPFAREVPPRARLVALEPAAARMPLIGNRRALWVLSGIPALARYLRTERPDVLVSTSTAGNLAALAARTLSRSRVPVVITVNTNLSAGAAGASSAAPLVGALGRRCIARAYSGADAAIAISRGVAEDLRHVTTLAGDRIAQVYNPIDVASIAARSRESVEHPWLQPGAPAVVLAAGKLKLQKDYPTLLAAFARVRASRPAHLVILGEGEERERIERRARELGLFDDLYMPGFVDNPFAWMARASVFVLSSAWEGLSNALLEALACGCPVVSTDCRSGPREILADGRFGRLVCVGDDAALAQSILETLEAPLPRERLTARAAEFGVDKAVDGYLTVLSSVCRLRGGS